MNNRKVVILLDIDDTLIDYNACTDHGIVWNGGLYLWQYYLSLLMEAGAAANLDIRFGLATFKNKLHPRGNSGDSLSATVLEDKGYEHEWIFPGGGLRKWISPELEFFTGGLSKVEGALMKVKEKFPDMASEDIFIVDDMKAEVCDLAIKAGFSAACVGNDLRFLTQDSRASRISKVFAQIFEKLKLSVPEVILAQMKVPEVSLKEAALALQEYKNRFVGNAKSSVISLQNMDLSVVKGLDEDDDDEYLSLNFPS